MWVYFFIYFYGNEEKSGLMSTYSCLLYVDTDNQKPHKSKKANFLEETKNILK